MPMRWRRVPASGLESAWALGLGLGLGLAWAWVWVSASGWLTATAWGMRWDSAMPNRSDWPTVTGSHLARRSRSGWATPKHSWKDSCSASWWGRRLVRARRWAIAKRLAAPRKTEEEG